MTAANHGQVIGVILRAGCLQSGRESARSKGAESSEFDGRKTAVVGNLRYPLDAELFRQADRVEGGNYASVVIVIQPEACFVDERRRKQVRLTQGEYVDGLSGGKGYLEGASGNARERLGRADIVG